MSETAHTPAEWTDHAALWTAWPSHPELWGDTLAAARTAVAAMCTALAGAGDRVHVLATPGTPCPIEGVTVHEIEFGDIWLRDTGPIFAREGEQLIAARFGWNGWGGKYVLNHDDVVGDAIADLAGAPVRRHDWILEGGAIETNGEGACLTTRQCLLNDNRNARTDEATVAAQLRDALGIQRVLWLDEGLRNDHTDGHVDNIARFVAPGVVMCMESADASDPNRDTLEAVARDLSGFGLEVIRIPSPGAITDARGELMAASYLNFVIGNGAVVVPVYAAAADDRAVAAIDDAFPGRTAMGIDARDLLTGGGAFHCITREQPA